MKKTRVLGVIRKKNRVLEHQGEFFQFSFSDLEIFWYFCEIKKKNVLIHFFIVIKIIILDINWKSKKTLFVVVEHTFNFRVVPVL